MKFISTGLLFCAAACVPLGVFVFFGGSLEPAPDPTPIVRKITISTPSIGTIAEQYPGAWLEPSSGVMGLLWQKGIRGCGQFYEKSHVAGEGRYLVACTADGDNWVGHKVNLWTKYVSSADATLIDRAGGAPIWR